MNLVELANSVFESAESLGIPHMAVGAIAAGAYGIPRATKDIDLLVSVDASRGIHQLIRPGMSKPGATPTAPAAACKRPSTACLPCSRGARLMVPPGPEETTPFHRFTGRMDDC